MAHLVQLFLVVMLLPTACRISEERPEIEVGMSRAEVLQLLGLPTDSEVVVKQTDFIWGTSGGVVGSSRNGSYPGGLVLSLSRRGNSVRLLLERIG